MNKWYSDGVSIWSGTSEMHQVASCSDAETAQLIVMLQNEYVEEINNGS